MLESIISILLPTKRLFALHTLEEALCLMTVGWKCDSYINTAHIPVFTEAKAKLGHLLN